MGTILVALSLSSCIISRHPAVITPSTKPLSPNYVVLAPVEESSCQYWVLLIPFSARSDPAEMIKTLIKEKGADALVGVTVEYRDALFSLPIMGSNCVIVKGQAAKDIHGG